MINQVTGAPVGFAGPVGMKQKIPIFADRDVKAMVNAVTGANEADTHLTGVNLDRDFKVDCFADLRKAVDGDPCPRCSSKLSLQHAIEIGHVFKLGTKYTDALNAKFLDSDEQLKPIIMGCYGIGVNRILAALIETNHDENGIIWSMAVAPYEVLLTPVKVPDEPSMKAAKTTPRRTYRRRNRRAPGRPRLPRRSEIQGCRPVGHSAPRGHRRTRPERRQTGNEMALGKDRPK